MDLCRWFGRFYFQKLCKTHKFGVLWTSCEAQKCGYRLQCPSNWEIFKEECGKEGKLCEWTIERLQEACDKVALEDIGRLSIAQDRLRNNTDFLRRVIAPVGGMGVTLSYVCPRCNCFPLDDNTWWVSTGHGDGNNRKKKHCNWWCAARGGQYEWRAPNMVFVVLIGANADRAKVFKAHAAPLGLCEKPGQCAKSHGEPAER